MLDTKPTNYYVASNGDAPERIYFSAAEAFASVHNYLDLFNEKGEWVESYKLVHGKYTNDF